MESVFVFFRNMFHALGSKTLRKNKILEFGNQRLFLPCYFLCLHDFNCMLQTIKPRGTKLDPGIQTQTRKQNAEILESTPFFTVMCLDARI